MTEKFRKDYKPLPVSLDSVHLDFDLREEACIVTAKLAITIVAGKSLDDSGLLLNGRSDVTLLSIHLNDAELPKTGYSLTADSLVLSKAALPSSGSFLLTTKVSIQPQNNTVLEGLYKSSGNYCTQCEAEGFRGVTYFFDRPDVMSKYTTRVEADKAKYPVLLSNGNLTASGDAAEAGRHFAVWVDPFPKPCYLFALVAGDLALREDSFVTMSGRTVALKIWVQHRNIGRVDHAMASLKKSMKWDEVTFGLEYDLDLFNIVAVDDFNMGAMENKSLNIFNSRLILATPETASDFDFSRIEGVIGHEYFHNWTGNRVTCQDWFQLTLKEGLTVYRDQEFSSDMNSRAVKRLGTVATLRAGQFDEDRGPMAHPVRPDSYIKMDNFYTATVYNKGAEVVRLYETVLGKAGFRKGMDLYFKRHDGQAVTCDHFLAAMADANGVDLSSLGKWYGQAGTPDVAVEAHFDAAAAGGTLTLTFVQSVPPTRGQPEKVPVLIPVRMALISPADGKLIPLVMQRKGFTGATETVLWFTEKQQVFVFEKVGSTRPVPSLFRGFSAPVKVSVANQTDEDLRVILQHDTDEFNRYEAGQVLARKIILSLYHGQQNFETVGVPASLVEAFRAILVDEKLDGAFKAQTLSLPSQGELIGLIPACNPLRLYRVVEFVNKTLAVELRPLFEAVVASVGDEPPYVFNATEVARRALVNKSFAFLSRLGDAAIEAKILQRMRNAKNMTDESAMLNCLNYDCPSRAVALAEFAAKWKNEPLVLLKWLTIQATAEITGNIPNVKALMASSAFTLTNPNCCYSLLLGFGYSAVNFHAEDGSGYKFAADNVLLVDRVNHQVASRLIGDFASFKQYDPLRQGLMKTELQRILATEGISDNIREIAQKSLE
jgi:aminopeptidase N